MSVGTIEQNLLPKNLNKKHNYKAFYYILYNVCVYKEEKCELR